MTLPAASPRSSARRPPQHVEVSADVLITLPEPSSPPSLKKGCPHPAFWNQKDGMRPRPPASDLERRRADVVEDAHVALGLAGLAHASSVPDQAQRQGTALFWLHDPVQVELDLHRVGLVRQLQPAHQAHYVGVDGQAGQPEGDRPDDVAGLAADARQRIELVDVARDLAAEALLDYPRHEDQALGLRAEET